MTRKDIVVDLVAAGFTIQMNSFASDMFCSGKFPVYIHVSISHWGMFEL